MGKYNVQDHIACHIVWKNPEYYAELFSDGCKSLKELLLVCFEKRIETYMCSSGGEYYPYMLFRMHQKDRDIMDRILAKLYSVGEGHTVQLMKLPNKDYIALKVTQFPPYVDYYIHDLLKEVIETEEQVQLPKEIESIIRILDNYKHPSLGLKFEYRYLHARKTREYKMLIGYDIFTEIGSINASSKIITPSEINKMVENKKIIK
jgi:hypothetical protein